MGFRDVWEVKLGDELDMRNEGEKGAISHHYHFGLCSWMDCGTVH